MQGPRRPYGRPSGADKKEPLRAGERFVAYDEGWAAIRCATAGVGPLVLGAQGMPASPPDGGGGVPSLARCTAGALPGQW